MHRWIGVTLLCFVAAATVNEPALAGNVLVIVADDVGADMMSLFWTAGNPNRPIDLPPTPNINALAADGLTFTNAWGSPLCSPARAAMQTGRYGFRTGVTSNTLVNREVPQCETTIAEALGNLPNPVPKPDRAAIGKWHLGNVFNGGPSAPDVAGYGHYAGSLPCCLPDYNVWNKTTNGTTERFHVAYATTDAVDEAKAWIEEHNPDPGPWFLWLAFNAAHAPHQAPPSGLHTRNLPDNLQSNGRCKLQRIVDSSPIPIQAGGRPCYLATLEAMDKEIGRLRTWLQFAGILQDTTIIFVGDNGTPGEIPLVDNDHYKATLYQEGLRVPLIISGAQVVPKWQARDGLVNTTDLFATIVDLIAGSAQNLGTLLPGRTVDSISLKPVLDGTQVPTNRTFAYSELLRDRAIRDARYKLMSMAGGASRSSTTCSRIPPRPSISSKIPTC